MTSKHCWDKRVYTQLYICGGRSSARILSASEQICMQQANPCLQASLLPRSPRALGRAFIYIYIERVNNNLLPTHVQACIEHCTCTVGKQIRVR